MLKNISAQKARDLMLQYPVSLQTECCRIGEAYGRVLAEDLYTRIPVPSFARSPYDGYAFLAADTANATPENPVVLKITEELPAGTQPTVPVTSGFAAQILTGAPVPYGADVTIKYEETEFDAGTVKIFKPQKPGNIVFAGEDMLAGELIAKAGTRLSAPLMGVLAGQGIAEVTVYKKPVITIINTGSELTEVGKPLEPAKIYNSNVYTLMGLLQSFGAVPVNGGICPDDPDTIAAAIGEALKDSDMVITTGGASVGDYDWAVTSAEKLGSDILFWKLDFKPGGSMMAAACGDKMILSLSGNPGAAVTGLYGVGLAYIKKLMGMTQVLPEEMTLLLQEDYKKPSPKQRFVHGRVVIENGQAFFREHGKQGNGVVSSFVDSDVLAEIPGGSEPLPAGTPVRAYRI